ncbi:hypothetical protein GIB67_035520 [Kingdonia uniflora]|uniref:HMA domain-containing protein n=1 Tax=Kingdonia uniflora TaxID=39325 RepID=A0A7J7MC94_9MAGN|nr:hypothetical protein GIB67_035520 [Kingdonia uniflora]
MVPELEKPRVTVILVRMDCNGCVQKIKKALHGINGIYDHYIDLPKQKLTVVGWADPERIVKAIRKTRKIVTICSHTELTNPSESPTEPAPEPANAPPAESPPPEATPPTEPPKDPPPPENPTQEVAAPTPVVTESFGPKDVEEVHVIHHHTSDYDYGYSGQYGHGYWNNHSKSHWLQPEPRPYPPVMSHNYNTYKPSPYISEYEYPGSSPPRQPHYNRMEHYSEEYHSRGNGDGSNITSMFSEENPNACTIV